MNRLRSRAAGRLAALAAGAALALGGCGEPEPIDPASGAAPTGAPTGVPAAAPAAAPANDPPATVDGPLEPVPRPDLSALKPTSRQQVEREVAELAALLAGPAAAPAELAERFGRVGRIYHAYGLHRPAEAAYHNAARLAGDDFRWPYLAAVAAQIRGDTATAEELLRRARRLAPEDQPALLRLAALLLLDGRVDEAAELYAEARRRDPESAAAAHGLGLVALSRGDPRAAVGELERALELAPEANSIHSQLGLAYARLGDRAAAERHLADRGEVPVEFPDPQIEALEDLLQGFGVHVERGLQAFARRRDDEAIAEYRAALALEPESPIALRGLALVLATAERHAEATATYERMLAIHPNHQLGRLEYATVLLQSGRLEEAIANFDRAIASDPDFEAAYFNRATAHAQRGDWPAAAADFRQVLRIDRDDVEARYYLGVALDELGRLPEAAESLRLAVAADPEHLLARQRLGDVLDRLGQTDAALAQYRAVLALAAAPDQEKALAHYQIGRLLGGQGRDQEALASLERAVELFPQFWQARFAVANWLDRHDRHREAAEIFGRLAAADPANVLARQREAEALMRDGRFALARRRLDDGLAAQPRSYELASTLARLLATAPEAALRDAGRALELARELLAARRGVGPAETVAMALAELGRFDEAVAFQEETLGWAASEVDATALARLRRNLERYRNRQTARQVAG